MTAWSPDQLAAQLAELGVGTGDVVMVHASLRRIGATVGGATGVIDAIQQAIGRTGTMLMTLGAFDGWSWVNDRPEHEREQLLVGTPPFDCLSTPAEPDIGVLAEVFRRCPGTRVTNNPEGRFGAAGAMTANLLDAAPWNDYYGPGSPLERFVQLGGKVLRLGADIDTVTLLHYAEYRAPLAAKRRVRRHRMVHLAEGGIGVRVVDCLDDSHGIVEVDEDYFGPLLVDYLATGRASIGVVGNAPSELIDGADLVDFAVGWMAEHLQ